MLRNQGELGDRLVAALVQDRPARAERIEALLAELERIDAWTGAGIPDDLNAYLADRRSTVAVALADCLLEWRRRGGFLALDVPERGEARTEDAASVPPVRLVEPAAEEPVQAPVVAKVADPSVGAPRTPEAPDPSAAATRAPDPSAVATRAPDASAVATRTPARAKAPPVEPEPAGPPATSRDLAELKSHLESGGQFANEPAPVDWRPLLAVVVSGLAPGRDDDAELERLHRVVGACQEWVILPPDIQRALIGHVAARLRTLQEHQLKDRRIDQSFLTLTAYSARERPGFVIGLNRTHRPMRGTWAEDADVYWDRIVACMPQDVAPSPNHERLLAQLEQLVREIDLAPAAARDAVLSQVVRQVRTALDEGVSSRDPRLVRIATPLADHLTGREFRQLRRAIRDEAEAATEEEEDTTSEAPLLPEDWGWWSRTRGRRALMVGGSPRETNRARLERAFEFGSLEWLPAEHRRNSLVSIRNRVRAGGVDLVVILRSFVGHDADEIILPACREHNVDWVHVDQGYGVVRVRQAVERFLDPAE